MSARFAVIRGKRLRKAIVILAVLALALVGSWFLLRDVLGTEYPLIPVSSGSMCVFQVDCDGFTHPFGRALHRGDLVAVQGISGRDVQSAYPDSDIIVFHTPSQEDGFTISRVVAKEEIDGVVYLRTKSDGQGTHRWPEMPDVKEYEYWSDYRGNYTRNGMISERLLVGKVVFRVPWFGYLVFLLFSYASVFVVVALIILVIAVRFLRPRFSSGKRIPQASLKPNALDQKSGDVSRNSLFLC